MPDWAGLDDPAPMTDVEAMRITAAREIWGMPLGCRLECTLPGGRLVSVGMTKLATFNKDEWSTLVVLHEDKRVCRERVSWWLEQKAASRGTYRIYLDKQIELAQDYARAQLRGAFPTTVGEVLDAWGWELKRVATEL